MLRLKYGKGVIIMARKRLLCVSSGLKTADAAIFAGECVFCGGKVIADGTNAAEVVLYDNASAASGTVIGKAQVRAADAPETDSIEVPPDGVHCVNGIYADVTGTNAEYYVYYRLI